MSDETPAESLQENWSAAHQHTRYLVGEMKEGLADALNQATVSSPVVMVATCSQYLAVLLERTLILMEGLRRMNAATNDTVVVVLSKMSLDDKERANLEERLLQVEHATVAEGELERLQEDLAGGVFDRFADLLRAATQDT